MNALAPLTPDPEQALTFFRVLFASAPAGASIHMRAVAEPKDGRPSHNCHYALGPRFAEDVRGFIQWCDVDRRAAYVLPGIVRGQGTGKADVISLPAVCVDFDRGDPTANLAQAEALIGPATIVVESGGVTESGSKLHAYWRLAEAAIGADIAAACRVREELAKRFQGDPAFKQPAQVIRIPGSIHFKGQPKLVRLRSVDPSRSVNLHEISKKLGADLPARDASNVIPFSFDFNRDVDHSDTDRVLTQDTHEGAVDDLTRFEAAGKAIGYHLHLVRIGTLPDLDAAWEAVKGWNQTHLVPPWDEGRLRNDFQRLVAIEVKDKGEFLPPQPAITTQAAEGWAITEWRADRFEGDPPTREWVVEGLIPRRTNGVFAAVGDAGKGMLGLRLGLTVACYPPVQGDYDAPRWFGAPVVARGAVVILTAEDDADEVHRRLAGLDKNNVRKNKPLYVVPMLSAGGVRTILTDV